ncbi:nucleoside triphosphate pyrophosphatase [Mycolicibacterium sp. P9-22]|uniref:Maf family protein n=1 Tax=Mycolicibacterium sp. P9-22 TaxID=2024613 RepID=UPI0011ED001E|nr:Maf family protein [Mycolicibacterium sp. P9-22]KAA0118069.1 septum formation inhibitor Maf [Mycolicibacterium sp. P9-22]
MTRLVLGSASAGRLGLLRHAGVEPLVVVSDVDEDAIIERMNGDAPARVVAALATAKAQRVAELLDADIAADCIVIGCDSMLEVGGVLSGKPGTVTAARRQWQSAAGRAGQLHTGHRVLRVRDGAVAGETGRTGTTTVHFGVPAQEDLDAYLATGEPLHVAGAFTLDGLGGWFIDRIEGDPSNVIGLSLPLLRALLADLGVSVAALWAANRPRE